METLLAIFAAVNERRGRLGMVELPLAAPCGWATWETVVCPIFHEMEQFGDPEVHLRLGGARWRCMALTSEA